LTTRIVYSANNATNLVDSDGYVLYRSPQGTPLTGYNYVMEIDGTQAPISSIYYLNSSTGLVDGNTGDAC